MQTIIHSSSRMGGLICLIKVNRIDKPKELTKEVQQQLTDEFKKDKNKNVWNKKYIRDQLILECNSKCVYCECFIGNGHKEMHIDHFHYKNKYKDEVVTWENLNPSCSTCNKNKSQHDTYETPIINPFEQEPKDYFYLKNYRYYSRNEKVDKIVHDTINVLGLNDTENIVKLRFEQGETLIDKINDIYELAEENKEILNNNISKKNRVMRGCKNILRKGIKEAEYSAFMATIIKNDENYIKLKQLLIRLKIWNEELQSLDEQVEKIKMQIYPDKLY